MTAVGLGLRLRRMGLLLFCCFAVLLSASAASAQTPSGPPVFEITPVHSSITFYVKASVAIKGKFDKWDAKLTFQSPEVSSGSLELNIQADSVDTGSGMKNGKLKGKDFFDAENN